VDKIYNMSLCINHMAAGFVYKNIGPPEETSESQNKVREAGEHPLHEAPQGPYRRKGQDEVSLENTSAAKTPPDTSWLEDVKNTIIKYGEIITAIVLATAAKIAGFVYAVKRLNISIKNLLKALVDWEKFRVPMPSPEINNVSSQIKGFVSAKGKEEQKDVIGSLNAKEIMYLGYQAIADWNHLKKLTRKAYLLDGAVTKGALPDAFIQYFARKYLKQSKETAIASGAEDWAREYSLKIADEIAPKIEEAGEQIKEAVDLSHETPEVVQYVVLLAINVWKSKSRSSKAEFVDVTEEIHSGRLPRNFIEWFVKNYEMEKIRTLAGLHLQLIGKFPHIAKLGFGGVKDLATRVADCWNNLTARLQKGFGKPKKGEVLPDRFLEHIRPLLNARPGDLLAGPMEFAGPVMSQDKMAPRSRAGFGGLIKRMLPSTILRKKAAPLKMQHAVHLLKSPDTHEAERMAEEINRIMSSMRIFGPTDELVSAWNDLSMDLKYIFIKEDKRKLFDQVVQGIPASFVHHWTGMQAKLAVREPVRPVRMTIQIPDESKPANGSDDPPSGTPPDSAAAGSASPSGAPHVEPPKTVLKFCIGANVPPTFITAGGGIVFNPMWFNIATLAKI
jgi:hypothetical protein